MSTTEAIIGARAFEFRADFFGLQRLENAYAAELRREWKWYKETPAILASGPSIDDAIRFFRAFVVWPAGEPRPTQVDVGVIFSTKLNAYTEAFKACRQALEDAMSELNAANTTEGTAADPQ